MIETEHNIQVAVIKWAALAVRRWPELQWLFAVPNGGDRGVRTAARLKAEGVKPGVSDLILPCARGGFHGLFLELKTPAGRVRPEQELFLHDMAEAGYRVAIARSFDGAVRVLEGYLKGEAA